MQDLISRRAAIDAIRAMQTYKLFEGDDLILVDKAEAQTELIMLPSAQQWIPCSERLPEDIGDTHPIVIICGDFGVSVGFNGEYVDGDRYWYDMGDDIERSTVTAWMPLPEPYKGGNHETD